MPPSPPLSALRLAELMGRPLPTPEQAAVIEAPLAPLLVVAGAGSGKTETMASRVVWLIANALVEPRQVLGLTFTRKAAHELTERITTRLAALGDALRDEGLAVPPGLDRTGDDLLGQRPAVHTYNGFALDLVTEHALAVGLDPEFTMLSPSASWQLAHEIVESSGDELAIDASPATLTAALVSLTSSLADHLVDPADLGEHLARMRDHLIRIPLQTEGRRRTPPERVKKAIAALDARLALLPLVERFARARRERAALDFSDQVTLAASIAREIPAAGALARDLHRVVLLDEFQDTSVAQLELLSGLFGAGHATCAVGDPQQAIYGWRGASSASLAGFAAAFGTPEQPVLQRTLSTSWRNDQAPLAVANRIAAPLRRASGAVAIPELTARPDAGEGAVEVVEAADERSEARAIARWILERRAESAPETAGERPPVPSAAVLVRARRQIPPLVEELEAAGLEVEVVGLGGLLHRPEVADVRALLECVDDPGRGDSLMRLLAGPRVRLGARDMAVLGRWREHLGARLRRRAGTTAVAPDDADEVTLLDAVDDLPPEDWTDREGRALSTTARDRLRDLQGILRGMRRRISLPLPDLVTAAISALGVDLALLSAPDVDTRHALHDLEAFRDYAAEFERTALRPGLGAFLALLEVSEDKEAALAVTSRGLEPDPRAVTIVTMHSAKGLEWDLVAVAGLAEGTVPSYDLRRARTAEDGSVRVPDPGWLGPLADAEVPTELRGDADILPELRWAEADTQVEADGILEEFYDELGHEALREDRRLVYVAVTRARRRLLLSSAAWRAGRVTSQPRSRYLVEALPVVPAPFHRREEIPEENPLSVSARHAVWPPVPGPREAARSRAAALVERARLDPAAIPPLLEAGPAGQEPDGRGAGAEDDLVEQTRRVLADMAARRGDVTVRSPARLSASQIVARAQDPEGAPLELLRPLPRRPSASARRGTEFHAWLEHRFGAGTLLELEDIEEIADLDRPDPDEAGGVEHAAAQDRARLRAAFEESIWVDRTPLAVEEPVTVTIGTTSVRGVIDAVYPDEASQAPAGGVVIVDWKTGRRPTGARRRARAVQLSVYRLAWHERTGLPLESIRTMFHYVGENVTDEVTEHPEREELARLLGGAETAETGEGAKASGAD
ncbi:ATP-dependent helicase [Brachybacterium huguangmaarense]|uniref:DNA 3'-5' helicase n=1 Tax=Brachybacterium huguangmaarense TaxID=1652028 RepID=A0ABY6G5A1_9MICO|nr:ATP-dependent DNA helicase [Brachybacterium huguangmaarense]UYG18285.1 ATP-dependent helicase [Brachybacterium huguangmaarense]